MQRERNKVRIQDRKNCAKLVSPVEGTFVWLTTACSYKIEYPLMVTKDTTETRLFQQLFAVASAVL